RGVDNATMKLLLSQPWKGNVRELDNAIEHAMILGDGEWITVADLPRTMREADAVLPPVGDELRDALRAYEKIHIETVLRRLGNDKRQAADALGLSLSSLYRKMNELGIPLVCPPLPVPLAARADGARRRTAGRAAGLLRPRSRRPPGVAR